MKKKLAIGASAVLLCGMALAYFAFTGGDPQLIEDRVAESPRPVTDLEFTKQHKFVKLDQDILEGLVHDVDTIQVQLFNGENVKIRINERQGINENDAIAYGVVEGDAGSEVVLSMAGDAQGGRTEAMAGTIDFSDGRSFRIDYLGEGVHKLVEIDHNSYDQVCLHPPGAAGFLIGPQGEKIKLTYQYLTMRNGRPTQVSRTSSTRRLTPSSQSRIAFSRHMRSSLRMTRGSIKQTFNLWTRNGGSQRTTRSTYRPMNWATSRSGPNRIFDGALSSSGGGSSGGGSSGGGSSGGGSSGGGSSGGGSSTNQKAMIDILVVYTSGAATAKGGTSSIKSLAGLAVGNVNTAYKNSGINATITLKATALWAGHNSTGDVQADIKVLNSDAAVKKLRTQNKADLVSALVPGKASGVVGVGSMPGGNGNANACWSVTRIEAVGAPSRTFAHEIGHNHSAEHDKGHYFTDSKGNKFRTLLAYQKSAGEKRIPYYSSPKKSYNGNVTGTTSADNASKVSKLAPKIANYK